MKLHNSHGTTGTDWYLPKQQASSPWNTHGTTTTTKQAKVRLSLIHGPHGRKEEERVYRALSSKSEYKREGSASDGQGGPRRFSDDFDLGQREKKRRKGFTVGEKRTAREGKQGAICMDGALLLSLRAREREQEEIDGGKEEVKRRGSYR
jgi:hypothetical protein